MPNFHYSDGSYRCMVIESVKEQSVKKKELVINFIKGIHWAPRDTAKILVKGRTVDVFK